MGLDKAIMKVGGALGVIGGIQCVLMPIGLLNRIYFKKKPPAEGSADEAQNKGLVTGVGSNSMLVGLLCLACADEPTKAALTALGGGHLFSAIAFGHFIATKSEDAGADKAAILPWSIASLITGVLALKAAADK